MCCADGNVFCIPACKIRSRITETGSRLDGPMNANARLLSVVGDIYDTTFDQALWNNTLKRLVEYAGARSCVLLAKGAAGEVRLGYQYGITPRFVQSYRDYYGRLDPARAI